jgi:hypothetical protein
MFSFKPGGSVAETVEPVIKNTDKQNVISLIVFFIFHFYQHGKGTKIKPKNLPLANSYFEVLSDFHQNQNFGQNGLEFLLFA